MENLCTAKKLSFLIFLHYSRDNARSTDAEIDSSFLDLDDIQLDITMAGNMLVGDNMCISEDSSLNPDQHLADES